MHELHDYKIHYSTHLFGLLDDTQISRQQTIYSAHCPLLDFQLELVLVPADLVPVGG